MEENRVRRHTSRAIKDQSPKEGAEMRKLGRVGLEGIEV